MLVLVCWVNHFTSHFWSRGYNKAILGAARTRQFNVIVFLFSTASFLGVVAVSVDRFLAVHLHLRYQELVTHKRVVAVVISIWLLSVFLSLMAMWVPSDMPFCYNSGLHQDLFSRETPQESDSGPSSTESKFCQPY